MKSITKNFILILVFIIGLQSHKGIAQTPSWQWAKSAGSTGGEMTTGTAVDPSGNLYAIGWYTSANITFGSTTLVNQGSFTSDVFLTKYDAAGNLIWAKSFGGADGELGYGIDTDGSGNVYITGWYTSANLTLGTFTLTNTSLGSSDVFIAKINPAGNTVWAKNAGGTSADRANGIAVDVSGNVFTTGAFASATINFGTGNLTNGGLGTNDFFITKHDPNGNTLWARSAGASNADMGNSVAIDSLGNVYVSGFFSSSAINFGNGILNNSTSGTQDLFVVKYDGLGTAVWSKQSGGTLDDFGNAIAVQKGYVYITGGFNSSSVAFGTTTLTNAMAGTSDVLFAKFDLNGNSAWAKNSGGVDSEAGNGIAVDSVGKIFITGFFISNSLTFGTVTVNNFSPGYRDLFITAYNGSGIVLWATGAGNSYDETAYCISVNGVGLDVYIGGTFNSSMVTFGSNTVFKGCGDDVLIAKLVAPVVGVNEFGITESKTGFPNPTNGKFTIVGEGQIIFYNSLGEIVLRRELKGNGHPEQNELDLFFFPKGVYYYNIVSEKKNSVSGRVVIQ